jgi:hypothetical protein
MNGFSMNVCNLSGRYKTPAGISQRVPNQNLHGAHLEGAAILF